MKLWRSTTARHQTEYFWIPEGEIYEGTEGVNWSVYSAIYPVLWSHLLRLNQRPRSKVYYKRPRSKGWNKGREAKSTIKGRKAKPDKKGRESKAARKGREAKAAIKAREAKADTKRREAKAALKGRRESKANLQGHLASTYRIILQ
jgi:hypothetical protein